MVPRQNVAKLIVAAASLGLLFVVLVLFWEGDIWLLFLLYLLLNK